VCYMGEFVMSLMRCVQCHLLLAEDGSGRGAAFVAAVATKPQQQQQPAR